MTGRGPFRVLEIPTGEKVDHDGRAIGDDWLVLPVEPHGEAVAALMVTTDHVHASEYGDLVPATQAGLARLVADCLNRTAKALGYKEWSRLCAAHDVPTTPPVDHPVQYETCASCARPILSGLTSSLEGGAWVHRCSDCWLVGLTDKLAAKPRTRSRRPRVSP